MVYSTLSKRGEEQQVLDLQGSADIEKVELFRSELWRQVLTQLLGFDPRRNERQRDGPVEGSVAYLKHMDEWVTSLTGCIKEREIPCWSRQMMVTNK